MGKSPVDGGQNGQGRSAYDPRYPIPEFLVDFLGGLVPGTLFLIGIAVALFPPACALLILLRKNVPPISETAGKIVAVIAGTPSVMWIALLCVGVVIAYVLGHLFYRQDPKLPNMRGFEKVSSSLIKRRKRDAWKSGKTFDDSTREEILREELACIDPEKCEFPFPFYHDYLRKRGLQHLLPFARWNSNIDHRSKLYMNLLKIRLRFYHPDRCGAIIRNEAHIRLASSSWYVAGALRTAALCGILVATCALGVADLRGELKAAIQVLAVAYATPVLLLWLVVYDRRRVEAFIHYQRLREVFFILETAFTAFRGAPELLDPPFVIGSTGTDGSGDSSGAVGENEAASAAESENQK